MYLAEIILFKVIFGIVNYYLTKIRLTSVFVCVKFAHMCCPLIRLGLNSNLVSNQDTSISHRCTIINQLIVRPGPSR